MLYSTLFESDQFNAYDKTLYPYYNVAKDAYAKRPTNYNPVFNSYAGYVNNMIGDQLGEKWLYVKNRDYDTVALACIDGLCDGGRINYYVDEQTCTNTAFDTLLNSYIKKYLAANANGNEEMLAASKSDEAANAYAESILERDMFEYEDFMQQVDYFASKTDKTYTQRMQDEANKSIYERISSKEQLHNLIDNNPELKEFIKKEYDFLKQFKSKFVKVYRGFTVTLTSNICKVLYKALQNSHFELSNDILQMFDNKTKAFSSFSTDKKVAMNFSGATTENAYADNFYLSFMMSGYTPVNNISFALTAYLSAKYGNTGADKDEHCEHELTLMNIESLRNLKLEYGNFNKTSNKFKLIKALASQDEDLLAKSFNGYYAAVVHNDTTKRAVNILDVRTGKLISDEWFMTIDSDGDGIFCNTFICKKRNRKFLLVIKDTVLNVEFDYVDLDKFDNETSKFIECRFKKYECEIDVNAKTMSFANGKVFDF